MSKEEDKACETSRKSLFEDLDVPFIDEEPNDDEHEIQAHIEPTVTEKFGESNTKSRKKKNRLEWFWHDMKQKHLMWIKAIFFLQSASLVTLFPYLTIHMRSLGFSVEDVALVNAAIPVADILGPPLAGLLADKIGNFRLFMALVTTLNGLSSLLLLLVPEISYVSLSCSNSVNASEEYLCQDLTTRKSLSLTEDEIMKRCPNALMDNSTDWISTLCIDQSAWHNSFWTYFAVRVVIDILRASSLMLFEGAMVVIIKSSGGDYGLQKLFGSFGALIFGPLNGKIIEWTGGSYNWILYIYCGQRVISALFILKLDLQFKKPGKRVLKNVGQVICQLRVFAFMFGFLMAGVFWGFLETYLFWFLQDLDASTLLMGMTLAIGTVAGLPMTIFSWMIVQKMGHELIMLTALLLYTIRLFGYSQMTNPSLALLWEFFKPVCHSLLMISAFTFVKETASVTTAATVEGIFGALYFGIGRGMGGLAGGLCIQHFGDSLTFLFFAIGALGSSLIYSTLALINKYCHRRSKTRSDENNL